jgi:methylase of polypeptide subunit release factors
MAQAFLEFSDPEDYTRLREALASAGFSAQGVLDALGVAEIHGIRRTDPGLLLRRTGAGRPVDTLIRLFLMERSVPVDAVVAALDPFPVPRLVEAGILTQEAGEVRAAIRLQPFTELVLAHDSPGLILTPEAENYVMGVARSSLALANFTIRRPVGRVLDLGCGCGVQGLLAAQDAREVVGVDRNPRAIAFSRFNARLNDISHADFREGDLFEPATGETFDRIVGNPPFVISPENRFRFRDGGMTGDHFCERIIRQVPDYLAPGGMAQFLINWAEFSAGDWRDRIRGWCMDSGCDVWVLRTDSTDPENYAHTWLKQTDRDDPEGMERRLSEWVAYFKSHKITAIGFGGITLRRRDGAENWFRADEVPEDMRGPCGEAVLGVLDRQDFLVATDDAGLLKASFQVSPSVRLDRTSAPGDGDWVDETFRLRLSEGFQFTGNADPFIAHLVVRCDGKTALETLVTEMAGQIDEPVEKISGPICGIVREMVAKGFLLPKTD